MGFLSRLFGAKEQHKEITAPDPGTIRVMAGSGIAYDAGLVDRLKDDHQELVRIFMEIKTAAGEGEFNKLPGLLNNLKLTFQAHIMLENVKFYVYVQQHCAHDSETSAFIFNVRKEMDDIAHLLVKFVKTYAYARLAHDTVAIFNTELDKVGAMLLRRVELEENRLYDLYQPKH